MSAALEQIRARPIAHDVGGQAAAEDESDISALIARLTAEVNQIACEKTKSIQQITNQMKMLALNALIEDNARAHDALVVDLRSFGARNHLMADRVHPTAFGQIAIAERALVVLAADGLPARVAPASLITFETTRVGRLRGDLTYAYRSVKFVAQAALQEGLRAL